MSKNNYLIFLFSSVFLILISYFYVDKPLVFFLHEHHSRSFFMLKIMANDIVIFLWIFVIFYYLYFIVKYIIKSYISRILFSSIYRFSGNSYRENKLFTLCNIVLIGQLMKGVLKFMFARYWPATFIHNNLSLINNNAYGFNWFKYGSQYGSFPSGHTTFIVSFTVVVYVYYPKLRFLFTILSLAVILGQIGMYYHFFSDIVGGSLLGLSVAAITIKLFNKD